jgi:hypothetical protein
VVFESLRLRWIEGNELDAGTCKLVLLPAQLNKVKIMGENGFYDVYLDAVARFTSTRLREVASSPGAAV